MANSWIQNIILGILIALVWALLSLPIIFYHLPLSSLNIRAVSPKNKSGVLSDTSNMTASLSCASPVIYSSAVCHNVLQQYSKCLPGNSRDSTIRIAHNRSVLLESVSNHIEIVKLFATTEECRETAVSMLCLHYLGPLCDAKHQSYRLSKKQCLYLSEDVCKKEWEMAASFVDLPDCNSDLFSNATQLSAACPLNETHNTSDNTSDIVATGNCTLRCADMFYCESGRQSCIPSCDWQEYPEPTNTVINVAVIVAASLGVLFSVLTLISAVIRRERMFTFPSIIVVYQTIAAMVIALFLLVGFVNKKALFCQSNNLLASTQHSTPFCVISAVLSHYLLMYLSLWWLCHTMTIYWKLQFPFHARNFEIENKVKYIHLASVLFCTVASFIPIAVIMIVDWRLRAGGERVKGTLGYGITRFPPIVCTGINRVSVYYSLILPINLLVPVGVTMLILVLRLIHKNSKIKESTDSYKRFIKLSSAQSKLLFVLCYYVIITLVSLTGLTIASREGPAFAEELVRYFTCELRGYNPAQPCDRTQLDKRQHPGLISISFIFVGLYPMVNFLFTTNLSEVKDAIVRCCCRKPLGEEEKSLMGKSLPLKSKNNDDSTDNE